MFHITILDFHDLFKGLIVYRYVLIRDPKIRLLIMLRWWMRAAIIFFFAIIMLGKDT